MTNQTPSLLIPRLLHERLVLGMWPEGLRPELAVPLAATQARFMTERELSPESIERLVMQRDAIFGKLQDTLPVEESLRTSLLQRHKNICNELDIRELTPSLGFPTINPQFLSWKTHSTYPAFSVYNINSPICRITFKSGLQFAGNIFTARTVPILDPVARSMQVEPELPDVLKLHLVDDLLVSSFQLECEEQRLDSVWITARYEGVMPQAVRDHIRAKQKLFDDVFIIANAPRWQRNAIVSIAPADPLVVGVKRGIVWLLATYDLTPVEMLAVQTGVEGDAGKFRIYN